MHHAELIDRHRLVAGVDEAGRGPLAGPVVAAAVILAPGQATARLVDSKRLGAAAREAVASEIRREALAWSIGWADRAEIDALNILHATMLAMRRAVLGLATPPGAVLVDGNRLPDLCFGQRTVPGRAVVRGDASVPAISAASILAKTCRDQLMRDLDVLYPDYAFARHKGYPTTEHRERLRACGPCTQHRRSFITVRECL
jgi:ribonuclease HII